MSKHKRLKAARVRAGFKTAAEAARHLRVPYGTYSGHESGSRGIKDKELQHYAAAFNVALHWLAYDHTPSVPESSGFGLTFAIGNVGTSPDGAIEWAWNDKNINRLKLAGSVAFDTNTGTIDKEFSLPDINYAAPIIEFEGENLSCIIVRGKHVESIARPGSVLYFKNEFHKFTNQYIGSLTIVGLSQDDCYVCIPTSASNGDDIQMTGATKSSIVPASSLSAAPIVAIVTPHGRGAALRAMGTRLIEGALAVKGEK